MFEFFAIGIAAGCIDAIAGGGGLITIPALMAAGLPPAAAVATNKVGAVAGSGSAALHFLAVKQISLRAAALPAFFAFGGGIGGAFALLQIDGFVLKRVIPFLLIAFAVYYLAQPEVGKIDRRAKLSERAFATVAAPCIGFYDGFFGPGTGSFLATGFVVLRGFNLLKATAYAKVLNFASNSASLLFFLVNGEIVWKLGLAMLTGQLIGGQIGAKLAIQSGQTLIRIVMVAVSLAISAKMLLYPA